MCAKIVMISIPNKTHMHDMSGSGAGRFSGKFKMKPNPELKRITTLYPGINGIELETRCPLNL